MQTESLTRPELDQCSPMGVHWCCVRITTPPVISLCGELTNGDRLADGVSADMCSRCLALAPTHAVDCRACAPWVAWVA